MQSNKQCVLATNGLKVYPNGDVRVCCKSTATVGNLNKQSLIKIWSSDELKQLRESIESGEKIDSCKACWELEKANIKSHRQIFNEKFEPLDGIVYAELGLSNLCNLACRMCVPELSTKVNSAWSETLHKITFIKREGHLKCSNNMEHFMTEFKDLCYNLKELSFSGGEPLIDKTYLEILKSFTTKPDLKINIVSNFSTPNIREWITTLKQFKSISLTFSLDGDKEVNDYVRVGSKFDETVKNILLAQHELNNAEFYACIAISAFNVLHICETLNMIRTKFRVDAIISSFDESKYVSIRNLPDDLKDRVRAHLQTDCKAEDSEIVSSCLSRLNDTGNPDLFMSYVTELDKFHNTNFSNLWK